MARIFGRKETRASRQHSGSDSRHLCQQTDAAASHLSSAVRHEACQFRSRQPKLRRYVPRMEKQTLTLGHSPDPDDAFMFYALAKELIPTHGFRFEHILQDIQTLNERATRGELDISAISIHAYAYVCDQYALLPSGASMGDG